MLAADIVVLAAFATKGDLERFGSRALAAFALSIEDHGIGTLPMHEKGAFERAKKGMVASGRSATVGSKRITEHYEGSGERFSEEFRCEFGYRLLVFATLAGGDCRAGGDAPERSAPSSVTQALLQAPDQHSHFHALGAAILVRLVEDDELPMLASSVVEQGTVVRADQQVLQHRVVGQQDVRWRLPHLVAKDEFAWQAALRSSGGVSPLIPGAFRRLAYVLPECRLEIGPRVPQVSTDCSEPLALVVRQSVHGVQDHRPCARLIELPRDMLTIELEEDGVKEALGLAACGAGRHDDVHAVDMRGADGAFLMCVQLAIDQRGQQALGSAGETLAGEPVSMHSIREPAVRLRKRPLQQSSLFAQGFLEGRAQARFLEEERSLQVVLVALPNSLRPISDVCCT